MKQTSICIITAALILLCAGSASAWYDGYDYRTAITVNNTGASSLIYHQFGFEVDTNTLVTTGHMQASGADCRITDASDNLIPFWNTTAFDTSDTKIWANATTLSTGNNTFYMYYGNSTASCVADGNDTFLQWCGASMTDFLDSFIIVPDNIVYEGCVKRIGVSNIVWGLSNSATLADDNIIIQSHTGGNARTFQCRNDSTPSSLSESPSLVDGVWTQTVFTYDGTTAYGYVDGNEINTGGIAANTPDENMGLYFHRFSGNAEHKWSFIRKYTTSEPSTIVGNEEAFLTPLTLFYDYGTELSGVTKNNQSWISVYINVSGQTNVTYRLYNATTGYLLQSVTNNASDHNFTGLLSGVYYYNVSATNGDRTIDISAHGTHIKAFGDSITYGHGCGSPLSDHYINQTATNRSLTYDNTGVPGSQLQDPGQIGEIYGTTTLVGRYTILTGVNDIRHWWNVSGGLKSYQNSLYAASAWLGLACNEKTIGRSPDVNYTGSWSNTGVYGLGRYSATNGDYLDVDVTGDIIYIASISQTSSQGTFSVYVDSVLVGQYNCSGGVTSGSGSGVTYSPYLIRLTGLSNTQHNVRIIVTSVSGNVYFDWIAGVDSMKYAERPIFYMGNTLYFTDAGYNTYMPGADNRNITDIWNNASLQVATELASDGLNVWYIDMSETYDPDTYCCPDGLHPQQIGHTHISTRYITAFESNEDYRSITLIVSESMGVPCPINITNTTGETWVNHVWDGGVGDITDSYNVSVNNMWHNTSPSYYNNTGLSGGSWSNITVFAYNNTNGISAGSISQNTQTASSGGSNVSLLLTAVIDGAAGNSIVTTETMVNGGFGAATLVGGGGSTCVWAGDDIPTGVDVWSENASLLLLVVLVSLLGLAILIIRGLQ